MEPRRREQRTNLACDRVRHWQPCAAVFVTSKGVVYGLNRTSQMASSQAILERGRGRRAGTPSDIPAPGWKDILLRVWKNIGEDRVSASRRWCDLLLLTCDLSGYRCTGRDLRLLYRSGEHLCAGR